MKKGISILIIIAIFTASFWYFSLQKKDDINLENNQTNNDATSQVIANNELNSNTIGKTNTEANKNSSITNNNAKYIANKHYIVIKNPVETDTGDKVELRELFWYYCPHCYQSIPYSKLIKQTLNTQTQFVTQPAIFSDKWEHGAWFFYVLEFLNEKERLHEKLFHAIHRDNVNLDSKAKFIKWLELNGVDAEKTKKAYKEYSVAVKINKAKNKSYEYKVNGVPVFIVNGKYWVDTSTAGGFEEMVKVIQYLINEEIKIKND